MTSLSKALIPARLLVGVLAMLILFGCDSSKVNDGVNQASESIGQAQEITKPTVRLPDSISMQVDTLSTITAEISGFDGDPVSLEWRITEPVGSNAISIQTGGSATVAITGMLPGQYTIEVVVSNGKVQAVTTASVLVNETRVDLTEIPMVSLVPPNPRVASTITAQHSKLPDHLAVSYQWYVNEALTRVTATPILDEPVFRGDVVHVSMLVDDGFNELTRDSASVTVVNTPPSASYAEIIEAPSGLLEVRLNNLQDPDGDEPGFTYHWSGGTNGTSNGGHSTHQRIPDVNESVSVKVIVDDGYDVVEFRANKAPANLRVSGLPKKINYGEPIEFELRFVGDEQEMLATRFVGGPRGFIYNAGVVNWTPKTFMLDPIETFYAYFESEAGDKHRLELIVHNDGVAPHLVVGTEHFSSKDVTLELTGWVDETADSEFVFIENDLDNYGQYIGRLDSNGKVSLNWTGTQTEGVLSRGSFLVDSNKDRVKEVVFAAGNAKNTSIQHRDLATASIIRELRVERVGDNYLDSKRDRFSIAAVEHVKSDNGNDVAIFMTFDAYRKTDNRLYSYQLGADKVQWNKVLNHWHPDGSGSVLSNALLTTADEGVFITAGSGLKVWKQGPAGYEVTAVDFDQSCEQIALYNDGPDSVLACTKYSFESYGYYFVADLLIFDLELNLLSTLRLNSYEYPDTSDMAFMNSHELLVPHGGTLLMVDRYSGKIIWEKDHNHPNSSRSVVNALFETGDETGRSARLAYTVREDRYSTSEGSNLHISRAKH